MDSRSTRRRASPSSCASLPPGIGTEDEVPPVGRLQGELAAFGVGISEPSERGVSQDGREIVRAEARRVGGQQDESAVFEYRSTRVQDFGKIALDLPRSAFGAVARSVA